MESVVAVAVNTAFVAADVKIAAVAMEAGKNKFEVQRKRGGGIAERSPSVEVERDKI